MPEDDRRPPQTGPVVEKCSEITEEQFFHIAGRLALVIRPEICPQHMRYALVLRNEANGNVCQISNFERPAELLEAGMAPAREAALVYAHEMRRRASAGDKPGEN